MAQAIREISVQQQMSRQRRERLAGTAGLIVMSVLCAALLVLYTGPVPLLVGLAALVLVAAIATHPRFGLYLLLFCALVLEQWGIAGLDPVTGRIPFYQTLAGTGNYPLPISPVEIVLLLTLAGVLLPHVARRGASFVKGALFLPLMLFLGFVVVSTVFGIAGGRGAGPFDPRAAWEEIRSFVYLGITYVLACNLIVTRQQLRTFTWLFIAGIGLKSAQGIVRYGYVQSNGIKVDAITGHEDVVLFSAFVLLLAALVFFGSRLAPTERRQMRAMFLVLPPLVFTLLVTNRRIGIVVLAAGLALVALVLMRTRRDLFLRLVPLGIALLAIYTVVFWNGTGTLSQPIRAVRSLVSPQTARDQSSNAWRGLENTNINFNIHSAPLTGLGFGRPYTFVVAQTSLDSSGFTYWRFIAHDAIYWLWMKMGLVGFTLFWLLVGSTVVLGLVTFRQLRDGYLKSLALLAAGIVIMQVIFSYGDLGLTYSRSMIFLGLMIGMLARLPALQSVEEPDSIAAPAPSGALNPAVARTEAVGRAQ